jgi:monoamine oxidase
MIAVTGGSQQDRVRGGMQSMANKMAAELGDAIHLSSPVRRIIQDGAGVTVVADSLTVRAQRVIVALPPTMASHIQYEPALPSDHALLLQRITAGFVIKAAFVYEEAFWRAEGLTGESFAPDERVALTLDGGFEANHPGVLLAFSAGAGAQELGNLEPEARKAVFLDAVVKRFGEKGNAYTFYGDHDWAKEEWTRGCYMAHYPPGVMSSIGYALREPEGRIHWAGTETSTEWNGWINGAIDSGNRVAAEVLRAG